MHAASRAPLNILLEKTVTRMIRLAFSTYGFAAAMALMAIIPGCNFAYSGHGGFAWLLVPFVMPVALARMWWVYRQTPESERASLRRFAVVSLVLYAPLSFVAAVLGARSIQSSFGLEVEPLFFWGMFTLPFGLPLAWGFFVL
jgi:hypothetical protein